MRDKKQFQMKLQVLEKKCRATNSFHPIRLNNGLTFASTVKRHKDKDEKKKIDINKGSPPSDLIGILKKRRAHEETKAKHSSHTARKALHLSSGKDCDLEIEPFKAVPNSLAGNVSFVPLISCSKAGPLLEGTVLAEKEILGLFTQSYV